MLQPHFLGGIIFCYSPTFLVALYLASIVSFVDITKSQGLLPLIGGGLLYAYCLKIAIVRFLYFIFGV